jgi:3-oxoadipate enol-lactonase
MRIEVRGRALGYDDTGGAGAPLVLIHGFPLDRTIWSAQVRGLADVARVVAPDLRGFGESAPSGAVRSEETTMDDYAADIAALLDRLGIVSAVVGGVSMGGYVAMAFHRAFARRLRGLVLVDTRGGPDSAEARKARDGSAALARSSGASAVATQMLEKLLTPANARPDGPMGRALLRMMSAQPVDGIVGALAAMRDRPDSGPSIARIAVPTLVVCGAEDTLIPPKESEALRDEIPGARLALIPGAAHLPNYEEPEAFNRVVREFLAALA